MSDTILGVLQRDGLGWQVVISADELERQGWRDGELVTVAISPVPADPKTAPLQSPPPPAPDSP